MTLSWVVFSVWGFGAWWMPLWLHHGIHQRGEAIKIQSLTPYSNGEIQQTLLFTNTEPRPVVEGDWLEMPLWVYTEAADVWSAKRYEHAFRLARWYFARCKIRLMGRNRTPRLHGVITQKGRLHFVVEGLALPPLEAAQTLVLLTRELSMLWGNPPRPYTLLGYSSSVRIVEKGADGKVKSADRPAVWVRYSSLIWTTFAHELGHRLGLPHIRTPYNLMLTGDGVRSSPELLHTSLRGYYKPQRFRFTAAQCKTMRAKLSADLASPIRIVP